MSGFIAELLILTVCCYFLLSLYKDREAVHTNSQDAYAENVLNIG